MLAIKVGVQILCLIDVPNPNLPFSKYPQEYAFPVSDKKTV